MAGGRALIPKKPLGCLPFAVSQVGLFSSSLFEFLLLSFNFQAGSWVYNLSIGGHVMRWSLER